MDIKLTKKTASRIKKGKFHPTSLRYIIMGSSILQLMSDMETEDHVGFRKLQKLHADISEHSVDRGLNTIARMLQNMEPSKTDDGLYRFSIPDSIFLAPYIEYLKHISSVMDESINILSISLENFKAIAPENKDTITNVEDEIDTFMWINKHIKKFLTEMSQYITSL